MNVLPIDALIEKLQADDFLGAISVWKGHCQSDGGCSRKHTFSTKPNLFCANMLHASLLGEALGGLNQENERIHTQAQNLKRWIQKQ